MPNVQWFDFVSSCNSNSNIFIWIIIHYILSRFDLSNSCKLYRDFFLLMLFPLFCRSIIDNLVNPVQEHSEEWKKSVAQLDKEHAKGRRLSKDIPIFFTAFVICDVLKS